VSVYACEALETDAMKTLIAAVALTLSASAAMAEAPCENPVAQACQKACAVMGAKYVLSVRRKDAQPAARVQAVRVDSAEDNTGSLERAQHLARIAGLSLDYIDGLTLSQSKAAIAAYCPR
jgi:hypothetical protein